MIARKVLVALVALAPVAALAQWPDAAPPPDADGPRPRQFGRFAPPSDQEVEHAMAFMRENAPNRSQAAQNLPDDGTSLKRNVMGFIVARYRMLQGIREDDPKLYETKVQQLRVEDELYGLLSASTPEEREKLRGELTRASKKMFELTLQERARRIERLKEMVGREEQGLASDQQQVDAQVAARVDALIAEGQAGLRKDMGGRRDHWRDRPTTQPGGEAPSRR